MITLSQLLGTLAKITFFFAIVAHNSLVDVVNKDTEEDTLSSLSRHKDNRAFYSSGTINRFPFFMLHLTGQNHE